MVLSIPIDDAGHGFVRDADMHAATGADVPSGVRNVPPDDIAEGAVRTPRRRHPPT
ncbi:hypothetical protein [Streptomyces heilongjiangensis]|uniref:Uncharacterized protein n=1 Tax=Streptomyces heilongjiangensis TaxID=945052 RepID=A0ABW1AZY9_9ACTN|nr:hypothetical protein [Streptomyces heilongjiangensis]MDC2947964.1 hypothetical protein [Streptomyces heilongjiangensis]